MSSTTFDAQLRVASLVAKDNPHLYFEIQSLNDFGTASLQALRTAVERIESLVQAGDEPGFVTLMTAGRRYLENRR
jgi:chorismate mutase/prephenate dehydrogenase